MGLHQETLDKNMVMRTLDETVHTLAHDGPIRLEACEALGIGTAEWEACRDQLIDELQEAEDWAQREETLLEAGGDAPPVDSQAGPEFVPSHATLALFQSAMNEHLDLMHGDGFEPRSPKWLSVLYQRLRAHARGKAPFIQHASLDDFRFTLDERATVALVSDWGTGGRSMALFARATGR